MQTAILQCIWSRSRSEEPENSFPTTLLYTRDMHAVRFFDMARV